MLPKDRTLPKWRQSVPYGKSPCHSMKSPHVGKISKFENTLPLWRTVRQLVPQKGKRGVPTWPRDSTPRYGPWRVENRDSNKSPWMTMFLTAHITAARRSQEGLGALTAKSQSSIPDQETKSPQAPRWPKRKKKKKETLTPGTAWRDRELKMLINAKWSKPDTKGQILLDFMYMKYPEIGKSWDCK